MKYIYNREQYKAINEANYGPFANDITWNDSLLGRLVSSVMRKAKTGLDLVRIQPVIARLSSEFESIKVNSVLSNEKSKEILLLKNQIIISSLIGELVKSIENKSKISEIKSITKTTIQEVKKVDFDEKDELVKQLEDFEKFLEEFKDEEVDNEVEEDNSVSDEAFIKETKNILNTFSKITSDVLNNKVFSKINANNPGQNNEKIEYSINSNDFYFKNFRVNLFKNKKAIQEILPQIQEILKATDRDKLILDIGKQVIMNKKTIGNPIPTNQLISESVQISAQNISKIISIISRYILGLEQAPKNLNDIVDDKNVPLFKSFIDSFNKMEDLFPKLSKSKPKVTTETRKYISSFDNFVKRLNETTDDALEAPEVPDMYQRISDYFFKKVNIKAYAIEKTKIKELEKKIDIIGKSKEGIIIDGHDSIFEVVKLFNRAYKIYTVRTITNRADGKVSPSTYSKYTAYNDNGSINGWSNGPFRNNIIFNQWENAVLDIFKKYPELFSQNTKIRLPKVSKPEDENDYEIVPKVGTNLKKFMTELLDGNKLYKGDSAQKKLIDEYFGVPEEVSKKEKLTFTDSELKDNEENANMIKEEELYFKEINELLTAGTFIKFNGLDKNEKPRDIYGFIQDDKNGVFTIAYSKTFFHFNELIKNRQGAPSVIKSPFNRSTTNKDGQKYFIRYAKIKSSDFNTILKNKKGEYIFNGFCTKLLDKNPDNFELDIKSITTLKSKDDENKESTFKLTTALDKINVDKNIFMGIGFTYSPAKLSINDKDNSIKKK